MASTSPSPAPSPIECDPDGITFFCGNLRTPVFCEVAVKSKSDKRIAYKVRCTSANVFRVQPPAGFITPGGSGQFRFWFQNRRFIDSSKHYFNIHMIYNEDAKDAPSLFANKTRKPDAFHRLAVTFSKSPPPSSMATASDAAPKSLMTGPSLIGNP